MKIRKLERHEYKATAIKWWIEHNKENLEEALLSDYGFIAESSLPVAVAFLYPIMGARQALLEYVVVNPEAPKEERTVALNALICKIEDYAKALGYSYLMTFSSSDKLTYRLRKRGFHIQEHVLQPCIKLMGV